MMLSMKTETKTYAIVRQTRHGRTWYQSKDAGMITALRGKVWTTASEQEAYTVALSTGGSVVTHF